ncbi:MAG TPA: amidohydrolase family protein [Euzebyales bacterium]|nr:amidohydrolase family protein [Euzebyales bacterium]
MADPGMSTGARTMLIVDGIHLPEPSDKRVVVWQGQRLLWIGRDATDAPPVDEVIEMPGAWATPGFVDAHVHATSTGLALDGLDLTGTRDAAEVIDRLRGFAARRDDDPIVGTGWEEQAWPDPVPPSSAQIAAAAPGRRVVLNRIDGHSCLVDPVTLAAVAGATPDGIDRDAGHRPTGWVRERAAEVARRTIWERLPTRRLQRARHAAAEHAAALGITSLHEMGHPGLSSLDDARAWAQRRWPVEVLVWWADIDPAVALRHGLRPGGDLFLDGAIGSRTAAVSGGYRDGPALGELFHDDAQVADFFVRCTREGVGGGVHAIGDDAIEQALRALEAAAAELGADRVRDCRHRLEHVELARPDHAGRMARLGVVASVQPAFDDLWGGETGLYARRFGREVALASNPLDAFVAAGCALAFSSDAPVTPMAPWAGVVAATAHRGGHGVDFATAVRAATLGGHRAAHQDDVGPLRAGHRADLAVWDGDPYATQAARICLRTISRGQIT